MRNLLLKILPILTITVSCHSQDVDSIDYTHLKDCTETVTNENAAFSELHCKKIGSYSVSITQQSPTIFDIHLTHDNKVISTEFDQLTTELPLESGKTIEWHLVNGEPKFMIFRLKWGTEDAPFTMNEYLVASRIDKNGFCTLATIDVHENKDANQKARDTIKDSPGKADACDAQINAY